MEAGIFEVVEVGRRREVFAHGRSLARVVFPGDSCGYRSRNTLGRGFRIAMSSDGAVSLIGRVTGKRNVSIIKNNERGKRNRRTVLQTPFRQLSVTGQFPEQ